MGLDMYLNRRIYIGANYTHNNITGTVDLKRNGKPIKVDMSKLTYIEEEVAYWRKANQIHRWFVENVQDGKDDCGDYDVSKKQLKELVEVCKTVLKTAKTVKGQILTGETWSSNEGHQYNYEDGDVIINQEEIAELLPTASGFFFGGTDYDEYYINDLKNTISQIEPLLAEEDNNGYFQYSSSW